MADEGQSRGSSWARWTGQEPSPPPDAPAAPEPAAEPEPDEPQETIDVEELEALDADEGDADVDVQLDWPVGDSGVEPPVGPTRFPSDDVPTDEDLVAAADAAADAKRSAVSERVGRHGRAENTQVLRSASLLPAIAGRVDTLDGQLRALGMRLDLLASTVGALRGAIGDRIDGYADAASANARRADEAIEEQRRSTERAMLELRRNLASTDDVLRRLMARVDEIASDTATLVGGATLAAQPAAALDSAATSAGGDAQIAAILDIVADLDERLAAGAAPPEEGAAAAEVDLSPVLDAIAALDDRIGDYTAAAGSDAPLIPPPPTPSAPLVEPAVVLDAIAALDDRLNDLVVASTSTPAAPAAAVAGPELAGIQDALAEIRTLVEVVVDTMPASNEGSGADLADRVAEAVLAQLDIDELARQVADRLEQRFEVVVEQGE